MFLFLNKKEKGFTLVETIVYIAITSILFLSLTSFVLFMKGIEKDADIKWTLERDARKIFSLVEVYANDAYSVTLPSSGSNGSSLRFGIDTSSKNPTRIYQNGDNLLIDVNGDVEKINSDQIKISNFLVSNLSDGVVPENVRVSFILSATTSDNTLYSENFYSSFTLRDYAN